MKNNTFKQFTSKKNPTRQGWYNTHKGQLYWFALQRQWSCSEDRISQEYPNIWYQQIMAPDIESKDIDELMSNAIHDWFELSYAQYLTIPRSALQSMPNNWQELFVKCLEELDETIDWRPKLGRYWVHLKSIKGHYLHDHLMDYERGRRRIAHRDKQSIHSKNANV